jgi:hypothetical protein
MGQPLIQWLWILRRLQLEIHLLPDHERDAHGIWQSPRATGINISVVVMIAGAVIIEVRASASAVQGKTKRKNLGRHD